MVGKCTRCLKEVFFAEKVYAAGSLWHRSCYVCTNCKRTLNAAIACDHNGLLYCRNPCYRTLFGPNGYGKNSGLTSK